MSQEHYPQTDRAEAGQTPSPEPGAESELMRDQAEEEVPPEESVPDEAAERADARERGGTDEAVANEEASIGGNMARDAVTGAAGSSDAATDLEEDLPDDGTARHH